MRRYPGAMWRLLRPVPVLSWSVCALVVGIAAAGPAALRWGDAILMLLGAVLVQGYVAHAFNEREDWRSGTDRWSQGVLSGGTRLIKDGMLSEAEMAAIGWISLAAALALGGYFAARSGTWVWAIVAVGAWAAVAYTAPPLRLAYRPLGGEWLAAFPAMLAATLGSHYILTGAVSRAVLAGGALHGLFCIGWLMQHHLPDIPADLRAGPKKRTTVAWVAERFGVGRAPLVPAAYFALAALLAAAAGPAWSAALALGGVYLAMVTDSASVADITRRQLQMIGLTVLNALLLALWFGTQSS